MSDLRRDIRLRIFWVMGNQIRSMSGLHDQMEGLEKRGKIEELALHELPKDGNGVYTITGTEAYCRRVCGDPLFSVFGVPLPLDFQKNLELKKEISWKFLSEEISPEVSKAVFTARAHR